MHVELINFSDTGAKTIELAAKSTRDKYHESEGKPVDYEYIKKIVKSGHLSILEHYSLSFRIEGVSRALTHQFVRHRIGVAYTQESQRYVDIVNRKKDWYVIPPTIRDNKKSLEIYHETINKTIKYYETLISQGIPAEDARFLLPNATKTSLVFSANIRSLFHFFDFRICSRAQWEIRDLALKIYELCLNHEPKIFQLWEPRCKNCPEKCDKIIITIIKILKDKYGS